jgi:hypothetical protein
LNQLEATAEEPPSYTDGADSSAHMHLGKKVCEMSDITKPTTKTSQKQKLEVKDPGIEEVLKSVVLYRN